MYCPNYGFSCDCLWHMKRVQTLTDTDYQIMENWKTKPRTVFHGENYGLQ